jgi:hypothetical protein
VHGRMQVVEAALKLIAVLEPAEAAAAAQGSGTQGQQALVTAACVCARDGAKVLRSFAPTTMPSVLSTKGGSSSKMTSRRSAG